MALGRHRIGTVEFLLHSSPSLIHLSFSLHEWPTRGTMRLWLGLVTVLVLLLCDKSVADNPFKTHHKKPPPCPENTVCIVFSDIYCNVLGVGFEEMITILSSYGPKYRQGYVWEKEGSPVCNKPPDFYGFKARLDIEPLDLYKWKISAILVMLDETTKNHKLEEFRFNFDGKSELTFSGTTAKVEFNKDGNIRTSDNSLEKGTSIESFDMTHFIFTITTSTIKFDAFTFEIAADGEKVIDFVGPVVDLEFDGHHFLLNDTSFTEKLNRLTTCDVSEIIEACYGSCDKIFSDSDSSSDSNSTAEHAESPNTAIRETNCPSTLWFHSPSDAGMSRTWTKIDGQLKCHMGWFQGNTTSGLHKIKPSMEVQCSAAEPPRMTSLAKIVIGVSCSVGGLMIVVLIVVICVLMKRKRNHEFGGNTEKKFTLRDSDSKSKAQTPVGMTKSTEREKI